VNFLIDNVLNFLSSRCFPLQAPRCLPGETQQNATDPEGRVLVVPHSCSMNRLFQSYERACGQQEPVSRSTFYELLSLPHFAHVRFTHKSTCHRCVELRASISADGSGDAEESSSSSADERGISAQLDRLGAHLVQATVAAQAYQRDSADARRVYDPSAPALPSSVLCMAYAPPLDLPGRCANAIRVPPTPLLVNCFAVANEGGRFVNTFFTDEGFQRSAEHAVAMLHAYFSSHTPGDIGDNSVVLTLYSDIYSQETCSALMLHYLISRILKGYHESIHWKFYMPRHIPSHVLDGCFDELYLSQKHNSMMTPGDYAAQVRQQSSDYNVTATANEENGLRREAYEVRGSVVPDQSLFSFGSMPASSSAWDHLLATCTLAELRITARNPPLITIRQAGHERWQSAQQLLPNSYTASLSDAWSRLRLLPRTLIPAERMRAVLEYLRQLDAPELVLAQYWVHLPSELSREEVYSVLRAVGIDQRIQSQAQTQARAHRPLLDAQTLVDVPQIQIQTPTLVHPQTQPAVHAGLPDPHPLTLPQPQLHPPDRNDPTARRVRARLE